MNTTEYASKLFEAQIIQALVQDELDSVFPEEQTQDFGIDDYDESIEIYLNGTTEISEENKTELENFLKSFGFVHGWLNFEGAGDQHFCIRDGKIDLEPIRKKY